MLSLCLCVFVCPPFCRGFYRFEGVGVFTCGLVGWGDIDCGTCWLIMACSAGWAVVINASSQLVRGGPAETHIIHTDALERGTCNVEVLPGAELMLACCC